MADALLEYRESPNKGDLFLYNDILDKPFVKHPKIYKNKINSACSSKAEIRTNFTNTIQSRTQVTITCATGGSDSEYMLITAGGTIYSLWIDTANDDTITGSTGADTDLSIQHDDTPAAATIATRGAALLNAQSEMISWAVDEVIYVIGADSDNTITSAANVDGPFTVGSITNGISLDIVSADAGDTQDGELICINEDGEEEAISFTMNGTTEVNISGTVRDVNGIILDSAAAGAITVHERGGTSLTFATVAASDTCTINARFYIPDGRHAVMILKASLVDVVDTTAPVGTANTVLIYVEEGSEGLDSVHVYSVTSWNTTRIDEYVLGSATQYITLDIAETDTDATTPNVFIEQVIITFE